ncbi:MAG: hypothetical protein QNK37_32150 [Acidobacteriota bacterium]|nr:hypothetical protein [Acidobacteriota bacterium]
MKALVVLRYLARIPSAILALLLLALAVGQGVDVAALTPTESLMMFFMFVLWSGLIVGWLRERLGGILILAGFAGFHLTEWVTSGTVPSAWAFTLFPVCGLLYLLSWWLHHRSRHTAAAN